DLHGELLLFGYAISMLVTTGVVAPVIRLHALHDALPIFVRERHAGEAQRAGTPCHDIVRQAERAADEECDAWMRLQRTLLQPCSDLARAQRIARPRQRDGLHTRGHPFPEPFSFRRPYPFRICVPARPLLADLDHLERPVARSTLLVLLHRLTQETRRSAHCQHVDLQRATRRCRAAGARPRPDRSTACRRPCACLRCASSSIRAPRGTRAP